MTGEPTVVESYRDPIHAHVARSRLEAAGITALVVDENMMINDPLLSVALGGVKVVVSKDEVEAARKILENKATVEDSACPKCGSHRLQRFQAGRHSAFLTILFLGFPIGRTRSAIRCEDCQHTWRE